MLRGIFSFENIPPGIPWNLFGHVRLKNEKNGFGSVQKSIFYGSNPGKCYSEPYFSWHDTVKKLKILFLTVSDSQKYGYR